MPLFGKKSKNRNLQKKTKKVLPHYNSPEKLKITLQTNKTTYNKYLKTYGKELTTNVKNYMRTFSNPQLKTSKKELNKQKKDIAIEYILSKLPLPTQNETLYATLNKNLNNPNSKPNTNTTKLEHTRTLLSTNNSKNKPTPYEVLEKLMLKENQIKNILRKQPENPYAELISPLEMAVSNLQKPLVIFPGSNLNRRKPTRTSTSSEEV
jgi:hypothetical protein